MLELIEQSIVLNTKIGGPMILLEKYQREIRTLKADAAELEVSL